jgi:iron complex transport system ATP-binding protein
MNIISAKNITYKVKDKTILSDINLSIPQGSFTSIVGMNGSGKTTLLNLIANIIKATNGEILIKNKDINSYSVRELAQNISYVFQNNEVDFDFSALQIVMMGRTPYQKLLSTETPQDYSICQKAMQETNTWHLRNRLINSLSGGERQRVFIARSLAQNTDIILLDEPVANLDLKHQIEIMKLLKDIQTKENTTILIVLHDLSLALKYSDYVLALKDGQMRFFDTAPKVLNKQNINSLFEINAEIIQDNNIIIKD